uniref:ZP domain-containing protein n=1 Tax=Panagrolaimus davidi TaxID=227884 RepID=A0A914QE71_9BILA
MKGTPASIYVKGNMDNEECVFRNVGNASIPLHKCNMRKKREINPNGIAYAFTVVVQLHPLFITKVDRAYNVNCFYMEIEKQHSVEIGVSDISPTMLTQTSQLPKCEYSIHKDSPHGALAKFAKVGDTLYHVWECPSALYSMLLHSCDATDGSGTTQMVVDEHGCSTDFWLFPQITYNDDLTVVMVESQAFNFPDKSSMTFNCQIKLCFKHDDCSEITPPKCGANKSINKVAGNSIDEDLETEQLIPTSASATSPSSTTTVHLSRSKATISMPETFPRPSVLPLHDNTDIPIEGSGELESEEIIQTPSTTSSTTTDATTTQTIQILKKGSKASSPASAKVVNRLQRHSPPKPSSLVNFDIQSPELTIMDDYLDPNVQTLSPTSASQQIFNADSSEGFPKFNDKICVPMFGFYGVILFILFFSIVATVFLIKSRKTLVHKFY